MYGAAMRSILKHKAQAAPAFCVVWPDANCFWGSEAREYFSSKAKAEAQVEANKQHVWQEFINGYGTGDAGKMWIEENGNRVE